MNSIFVERNATEHKPVVILAGWLGCKLKNLDRYAALYSSLHFTVMKVIASPPVIIMASSNDIEKGQSDAENMHQLAMAVIEKAGSLPYSHITLHVFSNGGCFLWESIRDILSLEELSASAKTVKSRLRGVVFDSSPAYYAGNHELLGNALKYCLPSDREKVLNYMQSIETSLGREKCAQLRLQRALDYWEGLNNCSFPVQSFYICSRDDKLTPFEKLYDLIQYRVSTRGAQSVKYYIFEDSAHCQHIIKYPMEYRECILSFLQQLERKNDVTGSAVFDRNKQNPRSRL
mmetsp:Transcript_7597/g.11414  ORF Transcript_7597/g.11414 Transcript_7597/m.11414 type:complete len:289 (-) Transcript_7597:155-1021(-)